MTVTCRKRNLSDVEETGYSTDFFEKRIKINTVNELLLKLYYYLYKNYDYNVMSDIVSYTNSLDEFSIDNKNINYIKNILIDRMSQSRFRSVLDIPKIIDNLF
jgi:hypothetical protein